MNYTELISEFLKDNILWVLGAVGSFFALMNKKVQELIRKPFEKKKEVLDIETIELNLNEKSLKLMEQYLKFQDARFSKLLDECKKQAIEIETMQNEINRLTVRLNDSKTKCKKEMDDYKQYMNRVHKYVQGLQNILNENSINFKKYDDDGLF